MGFLTILNNIFKSKELREYEYFQKSYLEMKEDKQRLLNENDELKKEIQRLNKQIIELLSFKSKITMNNNETLNNNIVDTTAENQNFKLAPKELQLKKLCDKFKNYDDVLNNCGMQENSLKVYLSRLRKKNYKIPWETEKYF